MYSQQCGYVLTDAETAQANMRAIFNVLRTSALEAEGGHKGRSVIYTHVSSDLAEFRLTGALTASTNSFFKTIQTSSLTSTLT